MAIGSFTVDTKQVIVNSGKLSPYADISGIGGFNWDERVWPSKDEEKATSYFPVLWDPSIGGLHHEVFQSGIGHGDDLKFNGVELNRVNNNYEWNPLISHGYYYRHYNERYLYSHESVNDKLSESEDINGNTVNAYNYELKLKDFIPVSANMYLRSDVEGIHSIETKIRQKNSFSGLLQDGEVLPTTDSNGDIIWANVDTLKNEFIVDRENSKLIFNKVFINRVGVSSGSPSLDDILSCELIGESSEKPNLIFTTGYFPLNKDSAKIYVLDPSDNSFEEWTIVEDIEEAAPGSKSVQLDYDTGFVFFGDGDNYGALPSLLNRVYITYEKTARIEYEPAFSADHKLADIDVNPLRLGTNRGFLLLSERDNFLARIEVAVNKPSLGVGLYGPMYVGGDYATITARAFNISNQPIPDIEITFDIVSGDFGNLNGQSGPVVSVTDFNGYAYSTAGSSSSLDSVTQSSTDLSEDRTQLFLDEATHGFVSPEDVSIFQVKTQDVGIDSEKLVIVYTYDSNAIDPNRYQDWLEAGSPRDAVENPLHEYYFKTGANIPLRPTTVSGNMLTYPVQLDAIEGDVLGYKVTTGKTIDISITGKNSLHRSTVQANPLSIKVQMPLHMTGTFVDHLNNYIYYGFRLSDEHTFAASNIGTGTFLTINPIESSQIRSQFDINI